MRDCRDITYALQDLRHLDWTENVNTSGTGGMFLKARSGMGTGARYYKLSCFNSAQGVVGHECVNELVASRLMRLLGVDHVEYRLVHAHVRVLGREFETWLSVSSSYRHSHERKQALDTFYDLNAHEGESVLDFCRRCGWGLEVERMLLVDYLIANRDRHGANIEVLRAGDGRVRLAPLFDNGLSLYFSCLDDLDQIERFDPLRDVLANNYVGSRSLEENLRLIQGDLHIEPLKGAWRDEVLRGLDGVIPAEHQKAIWRMIEGRWRRYEVLRGNR